MTPVGCLAWAGERLGVCLGGAGRSDATHPLRAVHDGVEVCGRAAPFERSGLGVGLTWLGLYCPLLNATDSPAYIYLSSA
eukprot:scaffold665907_cov117-Prasinocladus_malaysianus.AAC.1